MRLGDTLADRFVIEASVGRGGIGSVYRGWDLETEQPVAIKFLIHLSESDIKRFEREAALLADARLPGLVRHVDHGTTDDGVPYLVMEWLEGTTVAKRLEDPGFDIAEAVALVAAVAKPLAGLHARGIVHRDIKPENLVMTSDRPEDVTLIDLGLARSTDGAETRVTATGCVLGTPGYMSPEQVRGAAVDARTDVFALGCVLYECLTGYAAFAGENFFAVRTKILLANPPALRTLCPAAPRALEKLLHAMLAKDPADRLAGASNVGEELARLGALSPDQRRKWHTVQPTTQAPNAIVRPPVTMAMDLWLAIAWIQVPPEHATATEGFEATVVAHGGHLDRVDSGTLVAMFSSAADRVVPARGAIRVALAMRTLAPAATMIVATGKESLEQLLDRSARLLDAEARAVLVESGTVGTGVLAVDDTTAESLARGLTLKGRRVIAYDGP